MQNKKFNLLNRKNLDCTNLKIEQAPLLDNFQKLGSRLDTNFEVPVLESSNNTEIIELKN